MGDGWNLGWREESCRGSRRRGGAARVFVVIFSNLYLIFRARGGGIVWWCLACLARGGVWHPSEWESV